jgi:hypothetical protein
MELNNFLSEKEISILGDYLGGMKQGEIGEREGLSQPTICIRLKVAAKKLISAGFPVQMPRRGRPRKSPIVELHTPAEMSRLVIKHVDGGRDVGHWIDAKNYSRSD